MPRTKKTPKRYAFTRKSFKRTTARSNFVSLVDSVKALSNGSQMPASDMYDGFRRRVDIVPTKVPRNINDQVVWSRIILDTATTLSAVAETQIGVSFNLNQHPEVSAFSTVFDQYCIPAVSILIRGSENVATNTGGNSPRIYTVLDHDDPNVLAISAMKAYANCYEQRACDSVTRILYPRIAQAAYSGAFTSFANARAWIDAASPNVQHYSFKWSAEADTRATLGEVLVRYEIYYAFRNRH